MHEIRWIAWTALAFAGLAVMAVEASAQCGPQPNDCFATPHLVTATPFTHNSDTTGATLESGEPLPCVTGSPTLWYEWTPTTNGLVTIDTAGSSYDTALSVYSGNAIATLQLLACDDDNTEVIGWPRSSITMPCRAGETLRIQLGGWGGQVGLSQINISDCLPAPEPGCGYAVDEAPYDFTDINPATGGAGTPIPNLGYSQTYAVQPSPDLSFKFCDIMYQTFWLSGAGYICMGPTPRPTGSTSGFPSGCTAYRPTPLPKSTSPNAAVYGFWARLDARDCPGGSTNCLFYEVQGTSPDRVLVYQFDDVPLDSSSLLQSFQIKLFEGSNCFEVHYREVERAPVGWTYWTSYGFSAGYEGGSPLEGYEHFFSPATSEAPGFAAKEEAWRACPFAARSDLYVFHEDQVATTFDVSENDESDGAPFSVVSWTEPAKGALTWVGGRGTFSYEPHADQVGLDSFLYTIRDDTGTMESTTKVVLDVRAVNDAPSFEAPAGPFVVDAVVPRTILPWGHSLRPGPVAAEDEVQAISFEVASWSPALFREAPAAYRSNADGTPSATGEFIALDLRPKGVHGVADLCFAPRDDGGTATATSTWGHQATGVDLGDQRCVHVIVNGPPVAYFEPSAAEARPGQAVTFLPCPGAPPYCTHDPDGHIATVLWTFGDGATSAAWSPSHAYDTPGSFQVVLVVWDDRGIEARHTKHIEIRMQEAAAPEQPQPESPPSAPLELEATSGFVVVDPEVPFDPEARYSWRQVEGRRVAIPDPLAFFLAFEAPGIPKGQSETLTFALSIHDAQGAREIVVHVTVHGTNVPPVADAGADLVVSPGATVRLMSASYDPDGDAITTTWEQVPRPGSPIVNLSQDSFVAPDRAALLMFRLRVHDASAGSEDMVLVEVLPAEQDARVESAPEADVRSVHPTSKAASHWPFGIVAAVAGLAAIIALLVARKAFKQ